MGEGSVRVMEESYMSLASCEIDLCDGQLGRNIRCGW